MTIYHTLLEIMHPVTPERIKAAYAVLESQAQAFYPEGYEAPDALPGVTPDQAMLAHLQDAFAVAVTADGLEKTCIEARRALGELMETIGVHK